MKKITYGLSMMLISSTLAFATTWEANPLPAPANLDWSNADNWTTTAPTTGDTATFSIAVPGRLAPNLDSDRTVHELSFNSGANAFILGSAGDHTLSVGTGGIVVGSAGQVINHGITSTGTAAGTFINMSNPDTSTLTLNGTLDLSSFGANIPSFTMQGGTRLTIAGPLTTGTSHVTQGGTAEGTVRITSSDNTIAADRYTLSTGTLEIGGGGTDQFGGTRVITQAGFNSTLRQVLLVDADTNFNSEVRLFTSANATAVQRIGGNITSGSATFSGGIGLRDANSSAGMQLTEFTSASGGTIIFSGEVRNDDGAHAGGVRMVGDGTVRFSRAAGNTYSEGTIVDSGTLEVTNSTNSGTGTGAVTVNGGTLLNNGRIVGTGTTVNSGGTLAGTGTFTTGITLNAGGQIAPGNSIGTLNGQNLEWNSNDTAAGMVFELSNTDDASDRIALTGDFTMGAGDSFIFDFQNTGFYDTVTPTTYTLLTFDGSTFTGADKFDYTNLGSGLTGEFSLNGDSLQLNVIPEPGTLALVGIALGALALFRRRK